MISAGSPRWEKPRPGRLHGSTGISRQAATCWTLGFAGGFMADALARRRRACYSIDPAAEVRSAAARNPLRAPLAYALDHDVGAGEASALSPMQASMPWFASMCIEHCVDLEPGSCSRSPAPCAPVDCLLFDTINRNPLLPVWPRSPLPKRPPIFCALLPRGTHDPRVHQTP